MKSYTKLTIIISLIVFFAASIYSQQKKEDTLEYLYPFEVLITAPRLNVPLKESPFGTSVIDNTFLNTMPRSLAVDEPLKLVPGLKVDNQADGERVHLSVRGQGILSERGIRGIKVLLDGIPLNDPTGFTPDFYDVDWPSVRKLEVLRGPAASLYGGSSSSGIINIITNDAEKKPVSGKIFTISGTFNTWKAFGQIGTGWKDGSANLSISREMGDGYRVHTHFWANKLYAKLKYDPSVKFHIQPVFDYIHFYNENAEGLNRDQVTTDPRQPNGDAIPKNEFIETERFTCGLVGTAELSKNHSVMFTGFFRRTKYTETVPSNVLNRTMNAPGGSIQYLFHYSNKKISNMISIGGDIQTQTIDEYRRQNLGGGVQGDMDLSNDKVTQIGYGVFFLDRLEFAKNWSALLSVRYDKVNNKLDDNLKVPVDYSGEKNFGKATGRVGITYSLNKNTTIFANWGMGFLPPATEELDYNPDAYGGFNQNLTYAESQGPEAGIRGVVGKKFAYDLTGFYLQTKNDFDRFRMPTRPSETFYRNAGESRRFGAELYFKYEPVKLVTFQAAYTYSNFQYTNQDSLKIIMDDTTINKYIKKGNFLPNSPEHQFYADLQFNISKNFSLGFNSETYSRSYIDGANILQESVGGYTLWGARATYRSAFIGKSNCEVTLAARNIFSKTYIAFSEPDPGGNSYQPGAPLEVFLNVRVGF